MRVRVKVSVTVRVSPEGAQGRFVVEHVPPPVAPHALGAALVKDEAWLGLELGLV